MLPLSVELKNNYEAYTCIYHFLLVIMLMNISSEFLILLFLSHFDNFKNVCLRSDGIWERFLNMKFHILQKKMNMRKH